MALVSRHTGRPRKKKKPRISRGGQRKLDLKFYGEEPTFTLETTPTDPVARRIARSNALNWYSHFTDHDSFPNETLDFIRFLGYSEEQVALMSRLNWGYYGYTVKSCARMHTLGWATNEDEIAWARKQIDNILEDAANPKFAKRFALGSKAEVEGEEAPKEEAPKEPVKVAVRRESRLIEELDALEDAWIRGDQAEFNLAEKIAFYREPQSVLKTQVIPWIEGRLKDLKDWKKGDEQCREGMNIKKGEVTRREVILETFLIDVSSALTAKVAEKKPRKKKPIDPKKLVARLKFQQEATDLKIKSVDPVGIIGASSVILFNTKYRAAVLISAEAGKKLDVKGSNIINGICKAIRLRKPEQVIPVLLEKTPPFIMRTLEGLTTKMVDGKPRCTNETIILRIMK